LTANFELNDQRACHFGLCFMSCLRLSFRENCSDQSWSACNYWSTSHKIVKDVDGCQLRSQFQAFLHSRVWRLSYFLWYSEDVEHMSFPASLVLDNFRLEHSFAFECLWDDLNFPFTLDSQNFWLYSNYLLLIHRPRPADWLLAHQVQQLSFLLLQRCTSLAFFHPTCVCLRTPSGKCSSHRGFWFLFQVQGRKRLKHLFVNDKDNF